MSERNEAAAHTFGGAYPYDQPCTECGEPLQRPQHVLVFEDEQETRYADIQRVIHNVLDRDGQHEWDETSRLTEVIAPAVWNEIHTFPLAHERSAGAAPIDVERFVEVAEQSHRATSGSGGCAQGLCDNDNHAPSWHRRFVADLLARLSEDRRDERSTGAVQLDALREAFSDFDPCHECDNAEKAWAVLARLSEGTDR